MNRTTTVVVALIAAASLSAMVYAVPEQRALAWGHGGGHGGPGGYGGGCDGGICGGGFYDGPILPYWAYGFLGNGGVLISPPILAGLFDGCGFGCGGCC